MGKPRIYLETTIPSYLTARPSRDLIKAAQQEITWEWWDRRDRFDLFISQLVVAEARQGDPDAAAGRLKVLRGIPSLQMTEQGRELAERILEYVPLPDKAATDAAHIAVAAIHGLDYLLTWNCRHLANAALRHKIDFVCQDAGWEAPVICTPNELLEV